MADSVNEWTFCTEHRKAVDGGSCDECGGDRNLVQVVRRYYLDVAQNQVTRMQAVADAARVLQANVGRTTGPMWAALDRAFAEIGKPRHEGDHARKQDEKRRGTESDDKRKAREEHDRRRYSGWMP